MPSTTGFNAACKELSPLLVPRPDRPVSNHGTSTATRTRQVESWRMQHRVLPASWECKHAEKTAGPDGSGRTPHCPHCSYAKARAGSRSRHAAGKGPERLGTVQRLPAALPLLCCPARGGPISEQDQSCDPGKDLCIYAQVCHPKACVMSHLEPRPGGDLCLSPSLNSQVAQLLLV